MDETPERVPPQEIDPALLILPRFSEDTADLFNALAKAQGQYKSLVKDKKGNYGFYATLGSLIETIKEPFAANGLAYSQALTGAHYITTRISHGTQYYEATYDFGPMIVAKERKVATGYEKMEIGPHEHGSAQTYAKRYALGSMVGLTVNNDDDAQELQDKMSIVTLRKKAAEQQKK